MAEPETPRELIDIAATIADERPVDWEERTRPLDRKSAGVAGKLRVLEDLARVFREVRGAVAEAADAPAAAAAADPRTSFGWRHLEVQALLGEGGFAEVYRAYDPQLDRQVALKLRRATADDAAGARRYLAEARGLARVRHPNVVTVHGADVDGGRVGIWTDLIDGETLAAIVRDKGPFGPTEAAAVGVDLCRALAAVHAAGLVHGDVKPGNVMRERGGRIVLLDFGSSSRVAPGGAAESRSGTPVTAAPEVLRGDPATAAADVYGLGALLYHLVTGGYPVEGRDLVEIAELHRRGGAVGLLDRRPDLPPGFVAAVERALAPEPGERFASVGALERALRALGGEAPAPTASRRGRRSGLVLAAGLLVLAAGAWTVWRLGRDADVGRPAAAAGSPAVIGQAIVSTFPGNHWSPTFSVDGEMLAFVSDASGSPQIWVKPAAGGDPVQVTSGPAATSRPSWSSRGIVFARAGDGIWRVPPLGGEPRQISPFGESPSVSADGTRVVFEHDSRLWWVDGEGATPAAPIPQGPRRMYAAVHFQPAISADGRRVVYFHQENGPMGDLWLLALDGSAPRRLTFDVVEGGAPAWAPDGKHVVFWSTRGGSRTLWSVPADGDRAPEPLTTGAGEDGDPTVAPDGRSVVYTNTRNRWRLVAIDLESRHRRVLLDRRLGIYFPQISPDGTELAFAHHDGSSVHLFTIGLDGDGLRRITEGDAEVNIHPRWSGDGRTLVYYQEPRPSLRRIPVRGGPSEEIADGWTWETESMAQPDARGERIAYVRRTPHGDDVTTVWDRRTGRHLELPPPHLHEPEWLPDGSGIVGWTHDGEVRRCRVPDRTCTTLTAGQQTILSPHLGRLYTQRPAPRADYREVWSAAIDGGGARLLGEIGPLHFLALNFDVTPAGEIVHVEHEAGRSELWRLELAPPLR